MKKTPQQQKLEEMLRSSQVVSGGFLGDDRRDLTEIIDQDLTEIAALGTTPEALAKRMREITIAAIRGLGLWVDLPGGRRAKIDEAKGQMICPWPDDDFRCGKRVTTLEDEIAGETILWTDLSIHLIEKHGFFEGKGAPFRVEPKQLVRMLP